MNVVVTTFRNPFSFFCVTENVEANKKDFYLPENNNNVLLSTKIDLSEINHGQYVAVLWKNIWARGIISLESQFQIWLIDYGIYVRIDDKTNYVNLASEYKKYPSKVFEASVHGVIPIRKELNEMLQIENTMSTSWNDAAIKRGQELISSADKTLFVPIALLTMKNNDVVLGDLYIKKDNQIINLIDALEKLPVYLVKKPNIYMQKLSVLYTGRRQHRACLLKPALPHTSLSEININTSFDEYNALCAVPPTLHVENDCDSDAGSTITYIENKPKNQKEFKLTIDEIEQYANAYVTISGREYNVLNVLLNKTRDLQMCEQFKDAKSIGRANSRSRVYRENASTKDDDDY